MESVGANPEGIKKIVIYGGESSGKTTLSNALSRKLKCPVVPEYGRFLYEFRKGFLNEIDLNLIAKTQLYIEEIALDSAKKSGAKYIVCDTSPLTTLWYSLQMFGYVSKEIQESVDCSNYSYTILCDNDIPFIQDGTRVNSSFRQTGLDWHLKMLVDDLPLIVQGTVDERVETIIETLNFTL